MRQANVFVLGKLAGVLTEISHNQYRLTYESNYIGPPISLALPQKKHVYDFDQFPPFFDGLLPEGAQLEALLRTTKLDRDDYFGQLVTVGDDLVGGITITEVVV